MRLKVALLTVANTPRLLQLNRPLGRSPTRFETLSLLMNRKKSYFGIPLPDFRSLFYSTSKDRMWAPDGDQAFDDGSYVLQFDVNERVRVIAFRGGKGYRHAPDTLSDVWLPIDDFYGILQHWHDAFETEWARTPKRKMRG